MRSYRLTYPNRVSASGRSVEIDGLNWRTSISDIDARAVSHVLATVPAPYELGPMVERYPNWADAIAGFFAASEEAGVALDVSSAPERISSERLHAYLDRLIAHWNQHVFDRRLWNGLTDGSLPEAVVKGWAIETYFFIRGAIHRMSACLSYQTHGPVREHFLEHFVEEYDHYKFFQSSLERLGLDVKAVEARGPLPSTRAVITFMKGAARIHPLCYVVCSGLLESTGTDAERGRTFYRAIASHYDTEGTGWIDPMIEHVDLDEAYEHGDVLREVMLEEPTIELAVADRMVATGHDFAETLAFWSDDIVDHYARASDVEGVVRY